MKKHLISIFIGTVAGVSSALIFQLLSKPDGTIYVDPEDKSLNCILEKDPEKYRNGSILIFKIKK